MFGEIAQVKMLKKLLASVERCWHVLHQSTTILRAVISPIAISNRTDDVNNKYLAVKKTSFGFDRA